MTPPGEDGESGHAAIICTKTNLLHRHLESKPRVAAWEAIEPRVCHGSPGSVLRWLIALDRESARMDLWPLIRTLTALRLVLRN